MQDVAQLIPAAATLCVTIAFYLARPRLRIRKNRTFPLLAAIQFLLMAFMFCAGNASYPSRFAAPLRLRCAAALLCHALVCAAGYLYYIFTADILRFRDRNVKRRAGVRHRLYVGCADPVPRL